MSRWRAALALLLILAAGTGATFWGALGGAIFSEYSEIAPPSTPATDSLRIYVPAGTATERLVVKDSQGQVLVLSGVLYREVGNPLKDVAASTTETSIFTTPPTIKGNTLGIDRALRISLYGDFQNNTGSGQNLTVRVKFGGTTISTLALSVTSAAATRRGWFASTTLVAVGATNTQFAMGWGWPQRAVGVTGGDYSPLNGADTGASTHNAITEDSTNDKVLNVTIQNSNGSANQSSRVTLILVELL